VIREIAFIQFCREVNLTLTLARETPATAGDLLAVLPIFDQIDPAELALDIADRRASAGA
jgi:hypothetical protein